MKKRPRLLFVDDDRFGMRYLVERLEQSGCEVLQRTSVVSAIEYLREFGHIIDGVILDLMIPRGEGDVAIPDDSQPLGGKGVLRYIQTNRPGIPILILTNVGAAEALNDIPATESILVLHKLEHPPSDVVPIAFKMFGIG